MTEDTTRSSLGLLYDISRELAAAIDLGAVLERILVLSVSNVGADRGSVIVFNERQEPIQAALVVGNQLSSKSTEELKEPMEQGLAGWVVRNRQAAMVPNTRLDPRWVHRPDDATERSGAKSAICLPLNAREQLCGILTIVHPIPNAFTQHHLNLLQSIADMAGIAIHNARLYSSLQSATRRYRELFNDSIDPIFISNWQGRILEANRQAERVTGYALDTLPGKNVADFLDGATGRLEQDFENLMDGQPLAYESNLRTAYKDTLPVKVYVRRVQIENEANMQWTLRDMSERKALAALQEELTAMIYHDLRSPLSNIISCIDMLNYLLPGEKAETIKPIIAIALRSTDRMQRLISSLLDINRLEAGQSITHRQTVQTRKLIDEAAEAIQATVEAKHHKLQFDLPGEFPELWIDADMIRRVLINLLENAIKFTPAYGMIAVGALVEEGWVKIWVQDSGPGIPSTEKEHIFEKFIRLQADRYPKGVGLGLAFCRLAVQAHGGKIWVESQVDAGSRFVFTLPVAESV
ncbi:MAG TPA: ATP-binding protein [Levilinea sp.]|nr:ATP-binding protein [Levilinea sp.]